MADELIDQVDNHNIPTGKVVMKSLAHQDGLWHRSVHVWIYNQQGQVLLQRRASDKALYPDVWDISAAGHVSAGEEPIVSALRETEEELGLKAKENELQFFQIRPATIIYKDIINNEFFYIYFLKYTGQLSELKIQTEEVSEIKLISTEDLIIELSQNPKDYLPHGNYWLDAITEIRRLSAK